MNIYFSLNIFINVLFYFLFFLVFLPFLLFLEPPRLFFLFEFILTGDIFGVERLDLDRELDLDFFDLDLDLDRELDLDFNEFDEENLKSGDISCSAHLLQKPFLYGFFFVILASQLLQLGIYITIIK